MFGPLLKAQASLLLVVTGSVAAVLVRERAVATTDAFTLYAYGTNITGIPVIYADALAYIATNSPSDASIATNVTFTLNNTVLSASVNSTTGISNVTIGSALLGIDAATNTSSQVAFVSSNTTSGLTSSGFIFYGSQLFWSDSGSMLSSFYAQTDEDGVWKLIWAEDGTTDAALTPVTLKDISPS